MTRKKNWKETLIIFLTLACMVITALNSQKYFRRIDLTENKIYTISEVSRNIHTSLEEDLTITYFVSRKLEEITPIPGEIEDMLLEYAANNKGKIKVSVVDPDRTGMAQEVRELGIPSQQVKVVEKNEETYAQVFSGILIRYLDRNRTIPIVYSSETLEYDLTSSIYTLVRQEQKTAGIIIGQNGLDLQSDFSLFERTISEKYQVRELRRGQYISPDVDMLFILSGRDLTSSDLIPIDSYAAGGGNVFFGIDGVNIDLERNLQASEMEDAPVFDLIEHYGVTVEKRLVLDTYAKNFRVPRQLFGGTSWEVLDQYPHWVEIMDKNVNSQNPITARFRRLDLLWPSPIKIRKMDGLEQSVLVKSSEKAWIMDEVYNTNPYNSAGLGSLGAESAGQYSLAATVEGSFKRFYSNENEEPGEIGTDKTRIVVFGNSKFISDIIQYSDSLYNLEFILNCAEWLADDEDLMMIRTRTMRDMRLNRMEPENAVFQYLFSQFVNLFLVPVLVIGFGVIRFMLRKRKELIRLEGYGE